LTVIVLPASSLFTSVIVTVLSEADASAAGMVSIPAAIQVPLPSTKAAASFPASRFCCFFVIVPVLFVLIFILNILLIL
jgi:hypothetical protein